ncbi:MAG: universal stress protein, partial [Gemmatimonadales bacterium]
AEQLRGQGVQATSAAPLGHSVTGTLLDLARPEEGALIAIATHGRGGLRRLMLGSVADKLIRAAHVPVLVVRPTKARRFVVGTLPPR